MTSPPSDQVTEAIASIRARAARRISKHQRAIEVVTWTLGQPRTVYVIVLSAGGWMAANVLLPMFSHMPMPDPPPFFWMQGAVGFCALLTATLVLITQNRQTQHSDERAQLDLQVNLLAEQKIAKLIALIEELRRDLPNVHNRIDSEADAMQRAVDPHAVLSALENQPVPAGVEGIDTPDAKTPSEST